MTGRILLVTLVIGIAAFVVVAAIRSRAATRAARAVTARMWSYGSGVPHRSSRPMERLAQMAALEEHDELDAAARSAAQRVASLAG